MFVMAIDLWEHLCSLPVLVRPLNASTIVERFISRHTVLAPLPGRLQAVTRPSRSGANMCLPVDGSWWAGEAVCSRLVDSQVGWTLRRPFGQWP